VREGRSVRSCSQIFEHREDGDFVWLGADDPAADELDQIRQVFGLHELAVKDAGKFHLRPEV
jgi:magnesium transporter